MTEDEVKLIDDFADSKAWGVHAPMSQCPNAYPNALMPHCPNAYPNAPMPRRLPNCPNAPMHQRPNAQTPTPVP